MLHTASAEVAKRRERKRPACWVGPRTGEPPDIASCRLQRRWLARADVINGILALDRWADGIFSSQGILWPGICIISGHRSSTLQALLNPAAPQSLHKECPALAVDLRVGIAPASTTPREVWEFLGARWRLMGFRWGGDFSRPDNNHFDVGVQFIMARDGR